MLSIQKNEKVVVQPQHKLHCQSSRRVRTPCLRASALLFLSGVGLAIGYHWQLAEFGGADTFAMGVINVLAAGLLLEDCARFAPLSMVIAISSAFLCVSALRMQISQVELVAAMLNLLLIMTQLVAAGLIWHEESQLLEVKT